MSTTEITSPRPVAAQAPAVAPVTCGCGCGFPITPGMRVYLINQVPYTLGCVGSPVPVTASGPDPAPKPRQRYAST